MGMGKTPAHAGEKWTPPEEARLRREAAGNTPTRVIALKHGRTEAAIRNKAEEMRVSLKPVNQSPYGSGGKRHSR
jgi:hypothetical protein